MQDSTSHIIVAGVMGSGANEHREFAEPLGRWLAESGYHLLTGGGPGVMTAVSRAFTAVHPRAGVCIGVLPCADPDRPDTGAPGYPNPHVEIPIRTHLHLSGIQGADPRSRNPINVLSSGILIALPGGAGTSSEVKLALRYGTPVLIFGPAPGCIPGLPEDIPWTGALDEAAAFITQHARAI